MRISLESLSEREHEEVMNELMQGWQQGEITPANSIESTFWRHPLDSWSDPEEQERSSDEGTMGDRKGTKENYPKVLKQRDNSEVATAAQQSTVTTSFRRGKHERKTANVKFKGQPEEEIEEIF